jgi:ABC-type multidrug transport system fused ATPase/permease subunit
MDELVTNLETPRRPTNSWWAGASESAELPRNLFRYILASSGLHQVVLLLLTIAVFLVELVPLELQRRIINDLVKHRGYRLVIILGAVYAAIVLTQGGLKLVLNVYRGWVGERATRELRRRIRSLVGALPSDSPLPEEHGIGVSMIVAEVEPIGGFVGESVSEPFLQGGILCSVVAYMIHLEPLMALSWFVLFVPQLVFVPFLQSAINKRTAGRVRILRKLSISVVDLGGDTDERSLSDDGRIDRVFELNMAVFRLKFGMNFLMNLCTHLQIVAALLLGGWFVYTDQLEIGGVVAFVSAIGRLNDPWGDLVNYFRDISVTNVKFRLMVDAINQMTQESGVPHPDR